MLPWLILAIAIGLVLFSLIRGYGRLVALRHDVDQAWSDVDALLRQRHEQILALIDLCKRAMPHEAEVLSDATRLRDQADSARANADAASLSKREQALDAALSDLLARAEATPELKTAETFLRLTARLSELHGALGDRRARYNDAVAINNRRREQFPEILLAGPFGFGPRAEFEIDSADGA